MLRKVIAIFVLCFCVSLSTAFLIAHWAGLSLNMEMYQIVIIGALVLTNASYLTIILYKIDPWLILIIAPIFYIYDLIYTRFYKDMDERLKSLYLLVALVITTIIVHVIQRKKSSPR
jgi:hypothetical protein